jgi:hypothetical protein
MKEKTAKVLKCTFTRDWLNPKKQLVYYHLLQLDNGDIGTIGTMEKNPDKIKEGTTINYTIDGEKIKLSTESAFQAKKAKAGGGGLYKKREMSDEEYLGYAWSYAKDLIVAGKKMKDFKELKDLARAIYGEIKLIREEERSGGTENKE